MTFARPRFGTDDVADQGRMLARVSELIDSRERRGTLSGAIGPIDAVHRRSANRRLESGTTIGKPALAGW